LPKLLKPAGYRTGIIAKNHVIPKEVYPWDAEIAGNGRNVIQMAQQARTFIEDCGEKPFVLVLGYTDPHRAAKGFGQPIKGVPDVMYDPKSVEVPYHLPDQPEVRDDVADYYRSISRLDFGVGEMLRVLRETKHEQDTIVIFLSDNGRPFPGGKTTLYDSGVNLPLIIRAPGAKPSTTSAMASWIDIAPTILACANVKQPPAMIGKSLLPLLGGDSAEGWDEVFGSHQFHEITMYYPVRMLRTRTHKYLLNLAPQLEYPFASDIHGSASWQCVLTNKLPNLGQRTVEQFLHRPKEELYELTKDPNELKNVAADPANQQLLIEMRRRVRAWQEKTNDPWLIKYQHE
jgi:N-sulfoglucosamine sulfohydrolase